jgi:hypothetical protein
MSILSGVMHTRVTIYLRICILNVSVRL